MQFASTPMVNSFAQPGMAMTPYATMQQPIFMQPQPQQMMMVQPMVQPVTMQQPVQQRENVITEVEKQVEVENTVTTEQVVEVEMVQEVERIVEVPTPVEVPFYVEKRVEVIQPVYVDTPVEVECMIEVLVPVEVEKRVEVQVIKKVQRLVEVPQIQERVKVIERPVFHDVEKVVSRRVPKINVIKVQKPEIRYEKKVNKVRKPRMVPGPVYTQKCIKERELVINRPVEVPSAASAQSSLGYIGQTITVAADPNTVTEVERVTGVTKTGNSVTKKEVNVARIVDKVRQVPKSYQVPKIVEKEIKVDKPVQVPRPVVVQKPVYVQKRVEVERIVEVPVEVTVEEVIQVPRMETCERVEERTYPVERVTIIYQDVDVEVTQIEEVITPIVFETYEEEVEYVDVPQYSVVQQVEFVDKVREVPQECPVKETVSEGRVQIAAQQSAQTVTKQVRRVTEPRTAKGQIVDKRIVSQQPMAPRMPTGEKKQGTKLPSVMASTLPTVSGQPMSNGQPMAAPMPGVPMMQAMPMPQPVQAMPAQVASLPFMFSG